MYRIYFFSDEIYIAPSGVQKERMQVRFSSVIPRYFYAPGMNDRGHIVFILSVCLSVCLSVANFNLRYNF